MVVFLSMSGCARQLVLPDRVNRDRVPTDQEIRQSLSVDRSSPLKYLDSVLFKDEPVALAIAYEDDFISAKQATTNGWDRDSTLSGIEKSYIDYLKYYGDKFTIVNRDTAALASREVKYSQSGMTAENLKPGDFKAATHILHVRLFADEMKVVEKLIEVKTNTVCAIRVWTRKFDQKSSAWRWVTDK
jgi:hypothetical protein